MARPPRQKPPDGGDRNREPGEGGQFEGVPKPMHIRTEVVSFGGMNFPINGDRATIGDHTYWVIREASPDLEIHATSERVYITKSCSRLCDVEAVSAVFEGNTRLEKGVVCEGPVYFFDGLEAGGDVVSRSSEINGFGHLKARRIFGRKGVGVKLRRDLMMMFGHKPLGHTGGEDVSIKSKMLMSSDGMVFAALDIQANEVYARSGIKTGGRISPLNKADLSDCRIWVPDGFTGAEGRLFAIYAEGDIESNRIICPKGTTYTGRNLVAWSNGEDDHSYFRDLQVGSLMPRGADTPEALAKEIMTWEGRHFTESQPEGNIIAGGRGTLYYTHLHYTGNISQKKGKSMRVLNFPDDHLLSEEAWASLAARFNPP